MGDPFVPYAVLDSQLSSVVLSTVVNGRLIVATDTKSLYLDSGGSRIRISDVILDTYSNIMSTTVTPLPSVNKIYFATDTHQLLQATYESGNPDPVWHQLGGSQSEVITISSSEVILELQDNKIYYLTNASNASIQLTAASSLSYCTICFTAGDGTTWVAPNNARCIGYDCTGGIFTPVSGREYQIAVDKLNNLLTFYVINTRLDGQEPDGDSQVVINSDASVSLTVDQNTIYRLTSSSLSSLTISGVTTQFKYATIIFTSPSSDVTTFAMPQTGYYCKGAACEDGEFTPEADMRYNLALENEGDRIAIYVMEAL